MNRTPTVIDDILETLLLPEHFPAINGIDNPKSYYACHDELGRRLWRLSGKAPNPMSDRIRRELAVNRHNIKVARLRLKAIRESNSK